MLVQHLALRLPWRLTVKKAHWALEIKIPFNVNVREGIKTHHELNLRFMDSWRDKKKSCVSIKIAWLKLDVQQDKGTDRHHHVNMSQAQNNCKKYKADKDVLAMVLMPMIQIVSSNLWGVNKKLSFAHTSITQREHTAMKCNITQTENFTRILRRAQTPSNQWWR